MSFTLRFIALSMLVALVICQSSSSNNNNNQYPTFAAFNTYTALNPSTTSVQIGNQGYTVTLSSDGWVYGQPITLSTVDETVVYTTLIRNSGVTGIGLIGATCPVNYTPANQPTDTFVGDAVGACPADFATIYTVVPAGSTTQAPLSGSVLTVDNPVEWILQQPVATATGVLGIQVRNTATVPSTTLQVSTVGPTQGNTGGAQQYAVARIRYAYYVQTTGYATVCFQTADQFAISPGNCGEQLFVYGHSDQAAGILSTSITVLFTMMALIFFN